MKWFKNIFASRPLDLKKKEIASLRKKAMMAQRSGDLRAYGDLSKRIEVLEDEVVDLISKTESR